MKTKQIATFINDTLSEVLGEAAPAIKDSTDLIAFAGKVDLSNDKNLKEQLYEAIFEKVRRTYVYASTVKKMKRRIRRDAGEWGIWYEEIRAEIGPAVDNLSYQKENVSPFTVEDTTKVTARYFKAWATWEHDLVIYDRMLVDAFKSINAFGAFVSMLFEELDATVEQEMQNNENLTISTAMAGVLKVNKPTQCRNLLVEYNTTAGTTLTVAQAMRDKDFLTFAIGEIQEAVVHIDERTTLYNAEGTIDRTPRERLVLEVLNKFEKAFGLYLKKDTFHENFLDLPLYTTVSYWQSGGETMAFDDVSTIWIKNDSFANVHLETVMEGLELKQSGILAVLRDDLTTASVMERLVTLSDYNNRQERTVYYKKAEAGYGVNLGHNMIIFYVDDGTVSA